LLPAALIAVADGGEIWMLDSANFNTSTVTITQSVTILAIPGALGSLVGTGTHGAIDINGAGAKVTLRNLMIVALAGGANGINFIQGAELNVSECEFATANGIGIAAFASNSKVTIKNTVLRDMHTGFSASQTVVASLDGVHITGSTFAGVAVFDSSRTTISNSVLSGNVYGAYASCPGGGTVRLIVERSVVTGNAYGILANTGSSGGVNEVTVSHSTLTHNTTAAIWAYQNPSATVTVVSDGNTVTENEVGFAFAFGTPTIYTRGNNTVKFNAQDFVGVGSLTALTGQ
jgi:hypothetical protein